MQELCGEIDYIEPVVDNLGDFRGEITLLFGDLIRQYLCTISDE